jgi:hypothetical protein
MSTVHRLLDDAFAGVPLTPEVQDLKEEVRGNLLARSAELEADGVPPEQAAQLAFDELGDVHALAAEAASEHRPSASDPGSPSGTSSNRHTSTASVVAVHRVRPRPGFVVGIVLASIVTLVAVGIPVLAALGAPTPRVPLAVLVLVVAVAVGWLVGSALSQETTSNHPLPLRRALLWGLGPALVTGGLVVVFADTPSFDTARIAAGAVLGIAGVLLLTWLGATQTNRKKAWMRELAAGQEAEMGENRFERDPAAAARFGIYAAVIWVIAFVMFIVIGATIGWAWSWTVFPAALAVMMLVLARMLFGTPRE